VTASSGASPAVLDALPSAIHAAYVSGYSASLRTVFLIAVPVGAVAFLLSWTLKDLPLRTTTRAVDPADSLAPTARPTMRTSEEEMERALSTLNSREHRREVYGQLVQTAAIAASARAGWLLIRVGEHPGDTCRRLAARLRISVDDLNARLAELVQAGYVAPPDGPDAVMMLTSAGGLAHDRLFAARQERIQRFLAGWDTQAHPELLRLLSRFTHELAAGDEQPGRDLEPATPAG
jgi:DNA-binding MarR family transcriptional regulator